ncbi:hypothetical protein V1512DRAFT_225664 [Lipomyces arxii]|uniref:uncharacterized protein n=1 Tax=Lipomyces arxii TaxID=56418 RepID=UPI0034CEF9A4
MNSVTITRIDGDPGKVYYPLKFDKIEIPQPNGSEVLIKVDSVSLNHRDHFIRQHLYPGTAFGVTLGSDVVGRVVALGPGVKDNTLLNARVIVYPARGWLADPRAPEGPDFAILGGTKFYANGAFADYILVESADLVVHCPSHLSESGAASIPIAGLTAYRSVFTRAQVKQGMTVLITGCGGGVAIFAIQFAKTIGAKVLVTAGSQAKLEYAIKTLKVDGGVLYTDPAWGKQIRAYGAIDVVIDGSGGNTILQIGSSLSLGARIVCYGMTSGPQTAVPMVAVLKNAEFIGSTMGSLREFKEMLKFIDKHKIDPVIYKTVSGLDRIEDAFKLLMDKQRIGKIVVQLECKDQSSL